MTEFLAVYGAFVARVFEWFSEKLRLRIEVKTNMIEKDGFLQLDQKNEGSGEL